MPDAPQLSRRGFLAATGGLVLLTACGSSGKSAATKSSKVLNAGTLSIEPYVSSSPERLAFALSDFNGQFASGAAATLALQPPGGAFGAPMPTTLHSEGLPAHRGVYVVETPVPQSGIYTGKIHVAGHPDTEIHFPVTAQPTVPVPGGAAPRAASPTFADRLGVDPLCTEDPPCPLHTVSLSQVIGTGKPVAVMFATPARCQSRYCGPVLGQLLSVKEQYQDRIALVHVEIYKDSTSDNLVPTVNTWNLPGEPWLFGIDGTGRITARLDGAMGTDEVKTLLNGLVA